MSMKLKGIPDVAFKEFKFKSFIRWYWGINFFFFFNFGEIMTYSFMKTNCPHEVVQTKVWEKWHESENALKYPISLLLPQRGGEIKED